MGDLRIAYLNFAELKGVGNSAWATAAFAFVSAVVLANETCSRDNQEVKLWLVGVVILTVLRVVVRLMGLKPYAQEGSEEKLKWCSRSVDTISTCWFVAAHFLLYEAYYTREQYISLYLLCFQYMSAVYVKWLIYHAVHISLMIYPPASAEDQAYVTNAQYIVALFLAPPEPEEEELPKYHPMRYTYWGAWLEGHACLDVAHELVLPAEAAAGAAAAEPEGAGTGAALAEPGSTAADTTDAVGCDTKAVAPEETETANSSGDSRAAADKVDKADKAAGKKEDYPRRWDGMRDYTVCCSPSDPPVSALDLCGICLDTLRTKKQYGEEDSEDACEGGEGCAGEAQGSGGADSASTAQAAGSQPGQQQQTAQEKDQERERAEEELPWRLVSRYPCGARHYFHADCLCVWLEEADRRVACANGREVPVTLAICPCCRRGPPEWPKAAYTWPEDRE
jgi:hypothetical protein